MLRRLLTASAFVSLLPLAAACEDGPKQLYTAPPTGARNTWNDSHSIPMATTATSSYNNNNSSATNANELCTAAAVVAARKKYFSAPIQPPGLAAGLDIAGGPNGDGAAGYDPDKPFKYDPTKETWVGTTVEKVESVLCQGVPDSIYYGVTTTLGWGDANEVSVYYNANNRVVSDILLETGYEGAVEADSVDGHTHYTIKLNAMPIQKTVNGQTTALIIKWTDQQAVSRFANELYDALRHTFIPDFPADQDCVGAGHCIVGNNLGQGGYFWFTPVNLTFFVDTTVGTDIVNSTPTLIDLGKLKLLGFSTAAVTLKLDTAGEGPIAVSTNVYGTGKNCKYRLGMSFKEFKDNCAEPFSDPTKNLIEERKLFGSIGHGSEEFRFDVQGIDPNFTATLDPDKIVGDNDRPKDTDIAYEIDVDQESLGTITNDSTNNDSTMAPDWHGIGLVTLEWANLVQKYMKLHYGVTTELGDPDCIGNPQRIGNGSKVCSGIEGVATSAPPDSVPVGNLRNNAIGSAALFDPNSTTFGIAVGLKPGTWYSYFCLDAGGLDQTGAVVGYQNCFGTSALYNGYYFDTMQYMIAQAFGNAQVPKELANRRFFFKQWIFAFIKYLHTSDNPHATLADIDRQPIDGDNLFFDSGGGGFDFAEYVDRHTVNAGQPPTDVSMYANLTTSVMNNFDFSRHNFRGENVIYSVMTSSASDKPGAEKVLLSNLVGSSVILNTYGTYDCAVNTDPARCNGLLAPTDSNGKLLTDDNGRPLLSDYKGVFGRTIFHLPALGESAAAMPMTVQTTGFELLASAMVSVPVLNDPFNPGSGMKMMMSALVPYFPKGASIGFPVAVDGSRDKFVNTYNVDFTGETISANVDYELVPQSSGPPSVVLRGIETTDYLGLVFMCSEPNPVTGQPDLLTVRMYTPAQEILDWFQSHPAGMNDCDVLYQYSIYGNYPDFITSRTAGIRVGINPGYGGGVVTDVVVFDPNVVASLGE